MILAEPAGWAVAGTPANFVTDAGQQTAEGELFGRPLHVRWTPVAFTWNYGDGTVVTRDSAGERWSGDDRFTESESTHTYVSRDDRVVSLAIQYSAAINLGAGWRPVPGSVTIDADPVQVQVFSVSTDLARGDCIAYPNDPGCGVR